MHYPRQPSVGGVFNTTSGKLMKTYSSVFLSQHGQSWRQGTTGKVRVDPVMHKGATRGRPRRTWFRISCRRLRSTFSVVAYISSPAYPVKTASRAQHRNASPPDSSTHQLITALLIVSGVTLQKQLIVVSFLGKTGRRLRPAQHGKKPSTCFTASV